MKSDNMITRDELARFLEDARTPDASKNADMVFAYVKILRLHDEFEQRFNQDSFSMTFEGNGRKASL